MRIWRISFGISTILSFTILAGLLFPFSKEIEETKAVTNLTGEPSITLTSTKSSASLSINPTPSGVFATTSGSSNIAFSVSTDNYTGYKLSVRSGKTTLDQGTSSFASLSSGISQSTFSNGSNTQYNNKWGYRPNYYNSASNSNYYGITTTATTLDQTSAANSTAKSYNIALGARADSSIPSGTYLNNNLIIEAVANEVPSSILTVNYGTGVSSISVGGTVIPNGDTVVLIRGVSYAITMSTSTNYTFGSWDANSGTIGSTSTQSTTYTIGSSDATLTGYATFSGVILQNLASSSCTTTASTAYDIRDMHTYTIKRLNDGNCWMMENLDLGRTNLTTNLTSSNTNISTAITASTFNGWKKTSGTATTAAGEFISIDGTDSTSNTAYGTLYNYYAASGGTISGDTNSNNASYDICPAGWRLPTGNSYGEFQALYENSSYNTQEKLRAPIANGGAAFTIAGYFYSGKPSSTKNYGSFWASTRFSDTKMFELQLDKSNTAGSYPVKADYAYSTRGNGISIRCIMKKPTHTLTVSYGTGITNISINGITVSNGGTISLEQGVKYLIKANLSTSYGFSSWSATSGTVGLASAQTTTYAIGSSNATLTASATYVSTIIQNLPQSNCTTTASYAKDNRDNRIYKIKRLADGNCWMIDNLDLGRTTLTTNLTSANTNLVTTVTASTFNGWKKTKSTQNYTTGEFIVSGEFDPSNGDPGDTDLASGSGYGVCYNYCAVSAGTICTNSNSSNASSDLCPAGWRLPTGSWSSGSSEFKDLYTQYSSSYDLMRAPVTSGGAAFPLSGGFFYLTYSGATAQMGTFGSWWAATRYSNLTMFMLYMNINSVGTKSVQLSTDDRYKGSAARCIMKTV